MACTFENCKHDWVKLFMCLNSQRLDERLEFERELLNKLATREGKPENSWTERKAKSGTVVILYQTSEDAQNCTLLN